MNDIRFIPDPATGCLSEEDTKSYFSRVGIATAALCVLTTLASLIFSIAVSYLFPSLGSLPVLNTLISHVVSILSIYCVAFPVFNALLKPLPRIKPFREKLSLPRLGGGFCVCLLAMMVGNYAGNMILIWLEALLNTTTENPIAEAISPTDPYMVILTVVFMVILAPIFEELVFRRVLCNRLLPLGEGYAILVSAAIFGLFHGNFYQFPYAFTVGLVLALIYVKTGNIIYSILYHSLINLLGSVIGPWILSGIDLDAVNAMLESGTVNPNSPLMQSVALLGFYEMAMIAAAVVGIVLLNKAKKRGEIVLDRGILPPPKEHRVANIFCNVGVAAAITCFTVIFVLSLL